jgi:two-component system, OmpR family, alkaline phosphatase synthesis response regulator PhoP
VASPESKPFHTRIIFFIQYVVLNMALKLLVADDEAHIRMLLEQTFEDLEDDGVELLFAENGRDALALIEAERPQLVFLDVMMPHLNGMDVCDKVKNELAFPDIHVVLLTAKGQEIDKQKGAAAGADQYLTKPFDPDFLLSMARRVLGIAG